MGFELYEINPNWGLKRDKMIHEPYFMPDFKVCGKKSPGKHCSKTTKTSVSPPYPQIPSIRWTMFYKMNQDHVKTRHSM